MNKLRAEIMDWIKSLIIAFVVVIILNVFIAPTTVFGISMEPTLVEKDVLILHKTDNLQRGDIVSFKSDLILYESDIKKMNPLQQIVAKTNPHKNLVKRVIGVPGDSIRIENEVVYVNGKIIDEPYIGSPTIGTVDIKKIPDNEYFLMGDNRSHSTDSRDNSVGTVSDKQIIGKAVVRVYPFNRIETIEYIEEYVLSYPWDD